MDSLSNLSQANDRIGTLYSADMVGAIRADKIGLPSRHRRIQPSPAAHCFPINSR
jgi:hypothetical protein